MGGSMKKAKVVRLRLLTIGILGGRRRWGSRGVGENTNSNWERGSNCTLAGGDDGDKD